MRTKARAILIDALRDAHRWLDDLARSPNRKVHQALDSIPARQPTVDSRSNGGVNYEALFAHMSQIPLAFVPTQSNGRDVLMGA